MELVAFNPLQLQNAHESLSQWCEHKKQLLAEEIKEETLALEQAQKNKWKVSTFKSRIVRIERKRYFFDKIKLAVDAGYLLIPNLDCEFIAIRTKRTTPVEIGDVFESRWKSSPSPAEPESTPPGEGEYISPDKAFTRGFNKDEPDNSEKRWWYTVTRFHDLDFPIALAKPEIMQRCRRATKEKVFDAIGVVRNAHSRKGDPILVGFIRNPSRFSQGATFFLAWELNPDQQWRS